MAVAAEVEHLVAEAERKNLQVEAEAAYLVAAAVVVEKKVHPWGEPEPEALLKDTHYSCYS